MEGVDLILLGGRNLNQQQWIREVEAALAPSFARTHVLEYDHWKRGVVGEDVVAEAANLVALVDSLEEKDYAIFGKSMGTLVAAEAIKQGSVHPEYCIFAGTPIKSPFADESNMTRRVEYLFSGYQVPTLFIQNPDEKYMRPAELEETLKGLGAKNFHVVHGSGGVHSYVANSLFNLAREYLLVRVRK